MSAALTTRTDQGTTDELAQAARPARTPHRPVPAVTLLLCGISVAIFVGLTARGDGQSWDRLARWGYASSERVWEGAYWSVVSSAFVHLALWHLAFNVYWLWVLGGPVERTVGPLPYLVFVLVAATVSSSAQLAASGSTGHGASGIVYALFGLIWASRKSVPALAEALGRNGPLFWIWLVGCILATQLGVADIGNGAHVGGLMFGLLAAHWLVLKSAHRKVAVSATVLLVAVSFVPLFWCPWSWAWVGHRAFKAHAAGDYQSAIAGYRRTIALGGQRPWALENLALAYHATGARDRYAATLTEIRSTDPAAADRIDAELTEPENGPETPR